MVRVVAVVPLTAVSVRGVIMVSAADGVDEGTAVEFKKQ